MTNHRSEESRAGVLPFFIIAALFLVYASVFIWRTSVVVGGERYFCLFDDAMISMRYARNLASGHGFVMNPGERVEGITNPLWALMMAVVHLFPIAASKMSLVIQVIGAFFTVTILWVVRSASLMIAPGRGRTATGAMLLTAFYLPLVNWNLLGMEVSAASFLIAFAAVRSLRSLRRGQFDVLTYILLGIGTFIRIDMAVPYLAIVLFLAAVQGEYRNRHIKAGIGILLLSMAVQTLARFWYYGDLLPATYYLKMTGYPVLLRLSRGGIVFMKFIWSINPVLFFLPIILFMRRPGQALGLCLWLFLGQCAYSIYVGGDAWEDRGGANRYIALAMPLFFASLSHALSGVGEWLAGRLGKGSGTAWSGWIFSALIAGSLAVMNNNNAPVGFADMFFLRPHADAVSARERIDSALLIRQFSDADAKIAVTWAGSLPYFSERYTVDILGKTDPVIAREPMRQVDGPGRFTYFHPGHLKYNYARSIGELKPDVIVQFWGDLSEAEPFVAGKYRKLVIRDKVFFLRIDSLHIKWGMFGAGASH